ncbi:MAG: adenosine deaminase [Bdellovibrionales bacterium]|nr:adenosine deaminase [Bdellovibrionales bacterium]
MKDNTNLRNFIGSLPKAELHIHIEGSLEPDLMLKLSEKNHVNLKYSTIDEVKKAYEFENLQSFLDIYYEGASVLLKEEDFFDLAMAYFDKCARQNVKHIELFFDPQTHTDRGIKFDIVLNGLWNACENAKQRWGLSSKLIMCFLRHLSAENAHETLKQALPYKNKIIAVGLDSSEVGHPPSKFKTVFDEARRQGFLTVAHAGEEGPPEYIWDALDNLKVSRIDHGVRCLEDARLVAELQKKQVPLTVCPLSNVKLRVFKSMKDHCLKKLLRANLLATINSDDPAYFGGYLNENYLAAAEALDLSHEDLINLARNSFIASFLTKEEKTKYLKQIDSVN